jgi:hypothetical protein
VDGRVKPGHDEMKNTQQAGLPAFCNPACKRDALALAEHENLWGFEDLTLESPRLPPHIGTAARKHGLKAGTAALPL